jgi:hypothetical protein
MKTGILSTAAFALLISTSVYAGSMEKKDSMHKMDDMKKMEKMQAPFGGEKDVAFAKELWEKLEVAKLNSTPATPYVGGPPHGPVREILEGKIDGKRVIVKRNYGGEGVSVENVKKDRSKYLKAVTVMIKKDGYDPKNNDWYWAKYKADGSLHATPKGAKIAGKFPGCIACHQSASGGDLVFIHNKEANVDITLVDSMGKM